MEFDYKTLLPELRVETAVKLDYKTLINLCKTSRGAFGEICGRNGFWKEKTYYDFGDLYDIKEFGRNWWDTYQHYRSVFSKEFIGALGADPPDANLIYNTIGVIDERGFLIVDETDERGNTALIEAAIEGYGDIVQFLLEEGANPNLVNRWGDTALMRASTRGHTAIVEMLLNAEADPKTALIRASAQGHTAIVRMLLDAGVDPNLTTANGQTALMEASARGHTDTVEMLLNAEADPNLADRDGDTALMRASTRGHTATVEMLLNAEANPNLATRWGDTALSLASDMGHTAIVRILEAVTGS